MPARKNRKATSTAPGEEARASATGTSAYASRFATGFVGDFYRQSRTGLTVSSLALGTYLGESNDATDQAYADACRLALSSGVNVVDTAINYRCQRSERVVGRVLSAMLSAGEVKREHVVLCTKAGYVPMDGTPPASREAYAEYLRREYFDRGVLKPEELVGGGHAITPAFLEDQMSRSMANMGVQALEVFYVHNPEQQLNAIAPPELMNRMRAAFTALERCVELGKISVYGVATWSGLRLPAGSQGHLSIYDLVAAAESVAGSRHHFRVVQLPVNLSMSEAVRVSTQRGPKGRLVNVLQAADDLGIDVAVSAPLLQGQLTQNLPEQVKELFPGSSDAQRALGFARSLPGVLTVAVGSRQTAHLAENLAGVRPG